METKLILVGTDNRATTYLWRDTPEFFRLPVRVNLTQWSSRLFKRDGESNRYHEVTSENS